MNYWTKYNKFNKQILVQKLPSRRTEILSLCEPEGGSCSELQVINNYNFAGVPVLLCCLSFYIFWFCHILIIQFYYNTNAYCLFTNVWCSGFAGREHLLPMYWSSPSYFSPSSRRQTVLDFSRNSLLTFLNSGIHHLLDVRLDSFPTLVCHSGTERMPSFFQTCICIDPGYWLTNHFKRSTPEAGHATILQRQSDHVFRP